MESWWLIRLDDQKDHRMLLSSWFAIDYFKLLKIPIWVQLQKAGCLNAVLGWERQQKMY